jgi:hypothetical protein
MGGVGACSRRRHSDPSRRGPNPRKPYFVGRIIQGRTQNGRSQAASVLCATRAGLNATELTAFRCLNPLCKSSFCDADHGAATKNLDWLRTKLFRANFPRRAGTSICQAASSFVIGERIRPVSRGASTIAWRVDSGERKSSSTLTQLRTESILLMRFLNVLANAMRLLSLFRRIGSEPAM